MSDMAIACIILVVWVVFWVGYGVAQVAAIR